MTLFNLLSPSKNKEKWWKSREEKLREEFSTKEKSLLDELVVHEQKFNDELVTRRSILQQERESIEKFQAENEYLDKLVRDRKVELEKSKEELKDQIRLIEAKAKPDSVWVTAFTSGFEKAWDMMIPIMTDGVIKTKDHIRNTAIQETLGNLEGTISRRIKEVGDKKMQSVNELIAKKKEFQDIIKTSKDESLTERYTHYIEAINWILNDNKKA